MADWNGDGHPDLLVTGGPPAVAYGPLRTDKVTMKRLWPKAARDELNPLAPHVSTNPVLADWDGDGLLDVMGGARLDEAGKPKLTSEPGVYWWRNVGTKKEPKLGPPRVLIRETNAACATGVAVAESTAMSCVATAVTRSSRLGRGTSTSCGGVAVTAPPSGGVDADGGSGPWEAGHR